MNTEEYDSLSLEDKMYLRVTHVATPDNPYSIDDFNKEFGNNSIPNNKNIKDIVGNYAPKLKFVNKSTNPDPEYATAGSSGFDLRANLESPMTLPAGNKTIVPTGLFFEIPDNFEIQIRPRSGLAAKNGVTVLNSPGTIDADYRGEIKVILINHGHEPFQINNGDRIAQAVLSSVIGKNFIKLIKIDEISTNTDRGAGGFGSTGSK